MVAICHFKQWPGKGTGSNTLKAVGPGPLKYLLLLMLSGISLFSYSQERPDSLVIKNDSIIASKSTDTLPPVKKDTAKKKEKTPRGAAIRSAILPGWGQAYNNKYWKIPIVYGALGTTGAVFMYNLKTYRKIRFAYTVLINDDTANFDNVAPELKPFIDNRDVASLRLNRNSFRRNIDYTVLFFVFFWGLNVVDATVDAHLRGFNVSEDLSLKIKPFLDYNSAGIGLVLDIHKGKKKMIVLNN